MGGSVIFLPIIAFFAVFGILILGFFVFLFKLLSSAKSSSWKGKVIDKKTIQKRDSDNHNKIETYYHLVVETPERKRNVALSKELYDQFNIGDTIEKPKGTLYPKKV